MPPVLDAYSRAELGKSHERVALAKEMMDRKLEGGEGRETYRSSSNWLWQDR
jgi:hypothetical protein